MARQKKEFKALNCKLQSNIWDKLDEYCKETGANKTFVVEKALNQYLTLYQEKQNKLKELENNNI